MIDIPILGIGLANLGCSNDISLYSIIFGIIIDNGTISPILVALI